MSSPIVTDNPDEKRFEARIGDVVAGFVQYHLRETSIELFHTEVDDAFEGLGVGSALARTSLDAARDAGLHVVPTCPFIRRWIELHPDYQDLVTH